MNHFLYLSWSISIYLGLFRPLLVRLGPARLILIYHGLSLAILSCIPPFWTEMGRTSRAISGYLQQSQAISGNHGLSKTISGFICIKCAILAIFGNLWLFFGYLWHLLLVLIFGNFWQLLAISIEYQVSGCKYKQERASYCCLKLFHYFKMRNISRIHLFSN